MWKQCLEVCAFVAKLVVAVLVGWACMSALSGFSVGFTLLVGAVVGSIVVAAILELASIQATRREIRLATSRRALSWAALSTSGHALGRSVYLRVAGRNVTVELEASSSPSFTILVETPPSARHEPALEAQLRCLGVERACTTTSHVVVKTRSLAHNLGPESEGERLVKIARRVVELMPVVEELLHVKGRSDGAAKCPYCHDTVAEEAAVECRGCGAAHHLECFAEHGGCAIFGCGSVRAPAHRGLLA